MYLLNKKFWMIDFSGIKTIIGKATFYSLKKEGIDGVKGIARKATNGKVIIANLKHIDVYLKYVI